jgi:pimeloyl-ACP methyl ester carboxylesterase
MGGKFFHWLGVLIIFTSIAGAAEKPANYQWTEAQMNPRGKSAGGRQLRKIADVRLLPENQPFPEAFDCHEEQCRFDLFYFRGENFNPTNPKRKNILFIAGGPGQVVNNQSQEARMLGYLEAKHNVIYFDVRGAGRSVIEADNKFDLFLRAEYVADDIEKLRKAVLKNKPWDAIYTHSWGSVPGQIYAARFGAAKVKSLILSAPVVRDRDTGGARTTMTVENLANIYRFYRSQAALPCTCQDKTLPVKTITMFGNATDVIKDVRLVVGPPGTNNFCFLSADEAGALARRLGVVIDDVEERFGSVDFVTDHFAELQKLSDPTARLRFPKEFYLAIKRLQFTGAPELHLMPYLSDFTSQVNAALVIGHYLTLDARSPAGAMLPQRACRQDAPFFAASKCASKFCTVIDADGKSSEKQGGGSESLRAHDVLGLYDGVSRALLRPGMVQLNGEGCFTGKDLAAFATGSGGGKELVRAQARRIGADETKPACLWTPKKYPHSVRTLILKGARDTVIAGCQAEDFYREGLKGERALLEFRGMGHGMFIPTSGTALGADLTSLLEKFHELPTTQFLKDPGVLESVKRLQGEFQQPPASRAGCPQ